jgi:hypothetical protein
LFVTLVRASTAVAQTNTSFGSGALALPSSPDLFDSAFGVNALNSPTSGKSNTAIGFDALFSNTTGSFNTARGDSALNSNTNAASNTAV